MEDVLRHLAQAAALLLFLEFFVVLLIVVALCGGLAFGTHWVRGKTQAVSGKVNDLLAVGRQYIHRGTDLVAKPFIIAGGAASLVGGTAHAIRRRVQASRRPPTAAPVMTEESPTEPVNTLV